LSNDYIPFFPILQLYFTTFYNCFICFGKLFVTLFAYRRRDFHSAGGLLPHQRHGGKYLPHPLSYKQKRCGDSDQHRQNQQQGYNSRNLALVY
ncbi:MAG: hypothetical protein LBS84_10740, partial [Clostridiales bacterium]|nr:hypothetical protein [Clostridiales bacterium]